MQMHFIIFLQYAFQAYDLASSYFNYSFRIWSLEITAGWLPVKMTGKINFSLDITAFLTGQIIQLKPDKDSIFQVALQKAFA